MNQILEMTMGLTFQKKKMSHLSKQTFLPIALVSGLFLATPSFASTGIILWGNGGDGSSNQSIVAQAIAKYCTAEICSDGISLGGNILPRGVRKTSEPQFQKKFQIPYLDLKFPIRLILGESDYLGNPKAQIEYSKQNPRWLMPSNQYSFTKDQVKFTAIDTHDFKVNPSQTINFLKQELGTTAPQLSPRFKIVLGYQNLQNGYLQNGDETSDIKHLTRELENLGVDFYISAGGYYKELRRIGSIHQIVVGTGSKYVASGFNKETLFSSGSLGFAHVLVSDDALRLRYLDENARIQYERTFTK